MSDNTAKAQATVSDTPRDSKLKKLAALKEKGINPYPHVFKRTHKPQELQDRYAGLAAGTETQDGVSVAGRVMSLRNSGMFIDLHDPSGKIQIFCHKDSMSEAHLELVGLVDIGDIIGVHGTIRRTPRNELSVRATEVQVLTKSIQPLPEKHHGLTDVEARYRQRYVDLIMNDESRLTLRTRSKIVALIREYMNAMGAIEVETQARTQPREWRTGFLEVIGHRGKKNLSGSGRRGHGGNFSRIVIREGEACKAVIRRECCLGAQDA